MATDPVTAAEYRQTWQPLGVEDLAAAGCTTCVGVAVVLALLHVALHRSWPPYKAILPGLVVCTGLAVSSLSILLLYTSTEYLLGRGLFVQTL